MNRKREYMRFRRKVFKKIRTSNPPELVEQYLRRAVMIATRSYDDPDELLSELQTTLEDIVYTVFEEEE